MYTPHDLNPKKDHDALLVLIISLLLMPLTLGLFYLGLLLVVMHKAAKTPAKTPYRSATYLVFGKKLRRDRPDAEYRARLDRLLQCGFQHAILMGGQTGGAISEAQAGCDYLLARGLDRHCMHLETDSQNTLENLKNARQLLTRQNAVIISNRYHLARCSALASSLGIEHQLCAAENSFRCHPTILLKCLLETFYLHWFYSGKGWALLTRNRRMLSKLS
ncbi:MAG: YdcF family protein [Gammaproteobacteria bacterium]